MTLLFTNLRLVGYGTRVLFFSSINSYQQSVFVFCLSGAVLGLAANFAGLFLPNINRGPFSLVLVLLQAAEIHH